MHAELIEDDGESRYKVTDIIGECVPFTHGYAVLMEPVKGICVFLLRQFATDFRPYLTYCAAVL